MEHPRLTKVTPKNIQQLLLAIVQTWRPSEQPEYRGFRCAYCQQYKNESWHHVLTTGQYLLPVHMCNDKCEAILQNNALTIDSTKIQSINRDTFGNNYVYTPKTSRRFNEIIASWSLIEKPILKAFCCDECGESLSIDPSDRIRKGYHVWYKMPDNITLAELHFHRHCAERIGINTSQK
jgi:uncharacterized protein YlaI